MYTFAGPREAVWALLLDADVLAKTMPGRAVITQVAPDRYEGSMEFGIGPVAVAFDLVVTLTDLVAPRQYTMTIDGRGGLGVARGWAEVTLNDGGTAGVTTMNYRADLQVSGTIAAVGQRMLDSASAMLLRQGLDAMGRELDRRLAAAKPS